MIEAEDQIITFETYYDPMLAQIVRGRLEDSGISCFIADENMGTVYPAYNNAIGGIKLKVFARDLEKCKAIIAEDNSLMVENLPLDAESNTGAVCPHCVAQPTCVTARIRLKMWAGLGNCFLTSA
jgi:hypothetical protein